MLRFLLPIAQCRAKNSLITRVLPSVERVVHSKPSCPTDSLDAVIAHNRLQQFSLSCMREYCIFYPSFIESLHMTPALYVCVCGCVRSPFAATLLIQRVIQFNLAHHNTVHQLEPVRFTSLFRGIIYGIFRLVVYGLCENVAYENWQ